MAATGDKDGHFGILTGDKIGHFDTMYADRAVAKTSVVAQRIYVDNNAGDAVVILDADNDGNSFFKMYSAKGTALMMLTATEQDEGMIRTYQPNGKTATAMGATESSGFVGVFN